MHSYRAIFNAGLLCVQVDHEKSFELVKKAADLGEPVALTSFEMFYENGWYVGQNGHTALKYYKLGLEEGSFISARRLRILYKEGCNRISTDSMTTRNYFKIGDDIGLRDYIFKYCLNMYQGDHRPKYFYEIRKYLEIGRKFKTWTIYSTSRKYVYKW